VYHAYHDQGLEVIAVNVQEDPAGTKAFVQELGLDLPVLLDPDGSVSTHYQVTSLPTTYIIDRAGVIREVTVGGPLSRAYLVSAVAPLLSEAGG
jgi:cytochrome c biogenesis protein CcmG/thiol:disulfide interchange protein DsbE